MKTFIKKLGIIFTVLTLIVGLTACQKTSDTKGSSIDAIKERGKVIIGVFGDKPPFGYVDENGDSVGYDVYLAHQIAKDLLGDENKVEFVILEAANRIEYLKSNKVDIVLANFTVTEERKQEVDFAEAYMKVALGIVAPDGSQITSVDDLKGKKLIVNKGTTAELFFTENYPDVELISYEQNTETFQALVDGRGDALAHDNTLLFAWAYENAGFKIVEGNLGSQDAIAPAVSKGNTELLNWLNDEIKTLTADGFFEKAYDQELRSHFSPDTNPDDVIFR
ncbi:polar amino acid transport system substrate-binding protein [Mobilisporobacter senegalensis]|uniref:Polar amino acid transport system substrate-binding protein n=1 Tax=Mobilisporobacter senegalensis TaxID=1329262 RepID=A0A3N1XBQ2_9FIRM|nr:cysteine ABC transporter substrate-binding protein [Mobilisporobacter senegalensis]ROR22382.1 polar amino acid transport system substrate-binding protein [Mobilisporobacter senegalensis]